MNKFRIISVVLIGVFLLLVVALSTNFVWYMDGGDNLPCTKMVLRMGSLPVYSWTEKEGNLICGGFKEVGSYTSLDFFQGHDPSYVKFFFTHNI